MIISYIETANIRKAKCFCKQMGYKFLSDYNDQWFSYEYMGTIGTYAYYRI